MKKILLVFIFTIYIILFFSFSGCVTPNTKREINNPLIKNFKLSEKINPKDFFIEYDDSEIKPIIIIKDNEHYISYKTKDHDIIVKRIIQGNTNLELGKELIKKYNLEVETIISFNELYTLEQEKSNYYKELFELADSRLKKEEFWNRVSNEITKYSLIVICIGVIIIVI